MNHILILLHHTDINIEILSYLEDSVLNSLCNCNSYFHQLCKNTWLWERKIGHLFPTYPLINKISSYYRSLYNMLVKKDRIGILTSMDTLNVFGICDDSYIYMVIMWIELTLPTIPKYSRPTMSNTCVISELWYEAIKVNNTLQLVPILRHPDLHVHISLTNTSLTNAETCLLDNAVPILNHAQIKLPVNNKLTTFINTKYQTKHFVIKSKQTKHIIKHR